MLLYLTTLLLGMIKPVSGRIWMFLLWLPLLPVILVRPTNSLLEAVHVWMAVEAMSGLQLTP